jgi:hypothetical protein
MPRLEQYGRKWRRLHDLAAVAVEAGEHDLSRVLRLVEAEWRSMNVKPVEALVLQKIVTLPRAVLVGGRRDLITRVLAGACTPRTSMVVELGSGWGQNLLDLYLAGGPRTARYYALEPTEEGRECVEFLANLAPDLELTALPFDFEEPRYELPTDNEHVLVFTCHSIEQITELPLEAITGLFGLGASLTVVHFEPIGWQIGGGTVAAATEEHSQRRRYNQNLWPLLGGLADAGEIQIKTVAPDIIGLKITIASSLVVWRR